MDFVDRFLNGVSESGIRDLRDKLPVRFVSLQKVLEEIADANQGGYRDAARLLLILYESEQGFPAWYRWTDDKSRGEADPTNGADWGKKLLQHAERSGEPVRWPHPAYDDHDLPSATTGGVYHFLCYGPTLGFQVDEVVPFLRRHGVKGFAEQPANVGEASASDPQTSADAPAAEHTTSQGVTPVQRQVAQENAILAKLEELGFDPVALPAPPSGKASVAKQQVRKALQGYSKDVFAKAWKRLLKYGRIKHGSPP